MQENGKLNVRREAYYREGLKREGTEYRNDDIFKVENSLYPPTCFFERDQIPVELCILQRTVDSSLFSEL